MEKIIGIEKKNNIVFAEIKITNNQFVCNFTKCKPILPDWKKIDEECQDYLDEFCDNSKKYVLCECYYSAPQDLIKNMPLDAKIKMATGKEVVTNTTCCDGNKWYLLNEGDESVPKIEDNKLVINKDIYKSLIDFDHRYDRKDKVFPKSKQKAYEEIEGELEKINNEEVLRKMIEETIIKASN